MASPAAMVPKQGPIEKWKEKELPENPKPPTRPKGNEVGTSGRRIELIANYFFVEPKTWDLILVHYDVVIKQPGIQEDLSIITKARRQEIFEEFKKTQVSFSKLAYDGMKSAVSVGPIKGFKCNSKPIVQDLTLSNGRRKSNKYQVILKKVQKRNLMELRNYLKSEPGIQEELPSTIFQMIEILFRHTLNTEYLPIGQNSFFSKDDAQNKCFGRREPINGTMVAERGFFASLRPAVWKDGSLLLNIDVTHAVFYKVQPVIDFMKEKAIIDHPSNELLKKCKRDKLLKQLKGLKVRVTHSFPRTYKVIDIMEKGADTQMFAFEKKMVSVQDYLKETYPNLVLKYPKLNIIRVAPETRTVFLPIEVCEIAKNQKVKRRMLGLNETNSFIKFTAQPANKRLENIKSIADNNDITGNAIMKELGFSFSNKPLEFEGRVLKHPNVEMASVITPAKGQWNTISQKFFQCAKDPTWALLNYAVNLKDSDLSHFISQIEREAHYRGLEIQKPVKVLKPNKQNPEVDLLLLTNEFKDLKIIIFILDNKSPDSWYDSVKRIADRSLQIQTQCVLQSNVIKCQRQTITNIIFKMNAKMGGINYVLEDRNFIVFDKPVMIMGADVNHPPADKTGTPSIAAVVGSLDRHAFKYAVEVRPQTSRVEMIENMEEMTRNLLVSFHRANRGLKPERIIMYRDGVSESQFLDVLAYELKKMRDACTALGNSSNSVYQPAITFIVVQKQHHTRIFPKKEVDSCGKSKNVPSGTIVDTAVTHPTDIDFFMVSHEGIQGTSKPTHYRVLWDDSDLTIDQLQVFSFAMCHLYARCSRSVSIPTPAYYAHWAAYRGKIHLEQKQRTVKDRELSEKELLEAVSIDMESKMASKLYYL